MSGIADVQAPVRNLSDRPKHAFLTPVHGIGRGRSFAAINPQGAVKPRCGNNEHSETRSMKTDVELNSENASPGRGETAGQGQTSEPSVATPPEPKAAAPL